MRCIPATSIKSTIITKKRLGPIYEMEKLLVIWMDDLIKKRIPLSLVTIKSKARSLFENLKLKENNYEETFTASNGWFARFKKRANYQNVKISGEAASADYKAAEDFIAIFDTIIKKGEYVKEQIFNVDETALYWKKMPQRTYINKEEKSMPGFKAFKDRFTLLLGGNIAGYKLKPLMIYHSKKPRALKGINFDNLPLYYRSNKKGWMTQFIFEDWFLNLFIPEVKQYCNQKGIPFSVLLVLDNAPGHPPHIGNLHPNVKIVYLPPNTTSILQPMDQGAISTFKAHYLKNTFAQAILAFDNGKTFKEFWKNFNIHHAIKNIDRGWQEVTSSCMYGIWKKLTKHFEDITDSQFEKEKEIEQTTNLIVELCQKLNINIDDEDINQLIENDLKDLTNEELLCIENQRVEEETKKKEMVFESPKKSPKKFVLKEMSEAFSQINNAMQKFGDMDSDNERFLTIKRRIQEDLACYNVIYMEKKQQTTQLKLDMFLKKTITATETTTATRTTTATKTITACSSTTDDEDCTYISTDDERF